MNTKYTLARAARLFAGLAALFVMPQTALAAPLSEAAPPLHYWSAHAGLNNLSSWTGSLHEGGTATPVRLDTKRGGHLGLAWGRQHDRIRHEVELQHGRVKIKGARLGTTSEAVAASGSYTVLTVNALHHAVVNEVLSLYGGVGAGVARVQLPHISLARGCSCLPEADKTGFAWQARVGAEHRVSPSGLVFGQLGYLRVPGPRSEGAASIRYRSRGFAVASIGFRHQY
jgi:opacity protein-like surface antigen